MSKPTLFFSHSSKDKDMILTIKNKVMQYTSNTLDIFQSSDGESIPFGTNWIHKVEEGLKEAKVMFVFITENSISSGWIYFEAGYAYSKGVHVIPVGIGVSVGNLKAPLNLLQGFNITSADGLNNFLTIINREFCYSFPAQFTDADFCEISSQSSSSRNHSIQFDGIIQSVKFDLPSEYYETPSVKKTLDTKSMVDRIKIYLDERGIDYAFTQLNSYSRGSIIAVYGIKIDYKIKTKGEFGDISVSISPYNFEKSFALYLELATNCLDGFATWVHLRLKDTFDYIKSAEDCAALLLSEPEWFSLSKTRVGSFDCSKLDLHFAVFNDGSYRETDYVLNIYYDPAQITSASILELVSKLYELKLIYKNPGGTENA